MILKILASLFLVAWLALGGYLVFKFGALFGPSEDDPSETPGSRSFGVAHIVAVWVGGFALAVYCLALEWE